MRGRWADKGAFEVEVARDGSIEAVKVVLLDGMSDGRTDLLTWSAFEAES